MPRAAAFVATIVATSLSAGIVFAGIAVMAGDPTARMPLAPGWALLAAVVAFPICTAVACAVALPIALMLKRRQRTSLASFSAAAMLTGLCIIGIGWLAIGALAIEWVLLVLVPAQVAASCWWRFAARAPS